jgi:hypothetical protein
MVLSRIRSRIQALMTLKNKLKGEAHLMVSHERWFGSIRARVLFPTKEGAIQPLGSRATNHQVRNINSLSSRGHFLTLSLVQVTCRDIGEADKALVDSSSAAVIVIDRGTNHNAGRNGDLPGSKLQ